MEPGGSADDALWALIDQQRSRCLWFLRPDYYPTTREQSLRVLDAIQRHGDRQAVVAAAEIRQRLSPTSSAGSAAS